MPNVRSSVVATWAAGSGLKVEERGVVLATQIEVAGTSETRRRGLLGRERLDAGGALVIAPSQGIHTFGMRFEIDVVAVNRDGVVVKIRTRVPPRRIVIALSAFAIIELPAGSASAASLRIGDRLQAD